jgi:cellulose synthase/poly-beta-1,6-N-acetylglucosamine synthase-like glycosyltransferase
MRMLLEGVLCVGSVLLLLPALILLVEVLAALLPEIAKAEERSAVFPRTAILVPAHDEEGQIGETVRALVADLPPGASILVIADNCSDQTAVRATEAGATTIERRDADRVGKGYAISFGLQSLAADPPEVVILVDADCRVSSGGLSILARAASQSGRPIQAEYLITAPRNANPLVVVGALAILLRNRVRPRGLRRLKLPCHLTGSGMAFPWHLLRDAPDTGSMLVEDLVMGIEIALQGHPAESCPAVHVSSDLPPGRAAGLRQRRRWEHGQLHTLVTYAPRLISVGLAERRMSLIGLGLDLLVPPLALLVILQGAMLALALAAASVSGISIVPATLAAASLFVVGSAVIISWMAFGRQTLAFRHLVLVPLYLLWKVPLYVTLLLKGKQKSWERTDRGTAPPTDPPTNPPPEPATEPPKSDQEAKPPTGSP